MAKDFDDGLWRSKRLLRMVKMTRQWYRSPSVHMVVGLCVAAALCYIVTTSCVHESSIRLDFNITRRSVENSLIEALKLDKGMGCEIPQLDPFSQEVTRFDKQLPAIKCHGRDWVKCYHSKCRLVDSIRDTVTDVTCVYNDILYQTDFKYYIGPATTVVADQSHILNGSDYVKVTCAGKQDGKSAKWSGITMGFRPVAVPPAGRDHYDVLIFTFDSTARNGFIRRMPNSWRALREIGATVMEGYNIVGDGTSAALFPILTGNTELELPDVRRINNNKATLDSFPFIFRLVKQRGYRTAYFEDTASGGTFQYRFNGFQHQPADHYPNAFFREHEASTTSWWGKKYFVYCVGDTPSFRLMINITQQFLELDGKKFILTFISDISHDDFNMIQSADDDTAAFLKGLLKWAEDTLIIVMGDHGPRFAHVRETLQGKLEERLPLLAIRLPSRLVRARPHAQRALEANVHALSTPHDLHATLLDVLDMRDQWNPFKVPGADLARELTMLEPIPRNRSCSEAGIAPHWCTCVAWQNVTADNPFYNRTAEALIQYINSLFHEVRSLCVPRTLTSTEWVLRQHVNSRLLAFSKARDTDYFMGKFDAKTRITNENYQVKIVVGPGRGVYEASMKYLVEEDKFVISTRDISRTNAYRSEPACISATHPHLNPYCYCR